MSELKRYQNPEVFERLAMDYAAGLMIGRARKRFESLMQQHFYLQVVTEAYENKLANLALYLPEKEPPGAIWQNIQKELGLNKTLNRKKATLFGWWHTLGGQMAGMLASLSLLFGIGFSLVNSSSVGAYMAVMESTKTHKPMVMAMAKKGQGVHLKFMEKKPMPDDMTMKLWCIPKKSGSPMMMGDVGSSDEITVSIDKSMWDGLGDVAQLAISLEHKGKVVDSPEGEILYKGTLMIMEDNK
jgi:anti-sigma-K factor RskA